MTVTPNKPVLAQLSRRERQIMDVLIEHQERSAGQIQQAMPEPPSYSTVRALLARLVDKNTVGFRQEGAKYIYFPKMEPQKIQQSAIARLLKTFFRGSRYNAVNALLDVDGDTMDAWEIEKLERRIKQLKQAATSSKE